ncbi:MFS transporter [Paraburkholderia dipogonis]|uniref:MFS transporter n=1 Tax=Paraburkholderia dipogonis TaxID=1211383 RepID=A0A4Y8MHZ3_9BURK|nr:sugar efflux transporter [Paraburkholderia dipogonis]TFE37059.1 MFS transporter [Paraburkholderia dipogonis]
MNERLKSLILIPGFLPLIVSTLALGVAMSITTPFLSLFSVEQACLTPLQLGFFLTVIAGSGVATSIAAGKWTDRHGHHCELLLGALIASSLGFLLLCLVRNYVALVAIGILFLGTGGSAMSLVFAVARAVLPVDDETERPLVLATLRTVLSMAWVFGPSIGALVLAVADFHGLFLFAAAAFTLCGTIVWRTQKLPERGLHTDLLRSGDRVSSTPDNPALESAQCVPPHEDRRQAGPEIWRAFVALMLIGLAMSGTMVVLPLYVVHGMHGARIDVSVMLGLGAFLEIPMVLWLGARGSRLSKQSWLAAGAAVHVIYFAGLAAAQSVQFLIPMQAFNAFVVAVMSCLGMTYMQDLMPRSPGMATALFFNASRVGSVLSGLLSGSLVAALGYRGMFLICSCLAMSAFALFAQSALRDFALRVRDCWKAGRRVWRR